MKQLFELALQLEPPWRVVSSDFDFARRRVDLRLGFRAGSRFPCPQCGRACQAVEFTEGTWRQPDMMAFEAFIAARLPSVRCPKHGDVALTPSWASDHASLRDLIRDANTDPQEQSLRWPAASSVTIDLASCQHPSVLLPHEGERLDHQRGRSCLGTAASVLGRWRQTSACRFRSR
jgi:hypothetical protein